MEDKLSIRINIADKYYPLKVKREDEERMRKAAGIVNESLLKYKKSFSSEDDSDYMAMVAFQYAAQYLEVKEKLNQAEIIENLESLNGQLENHLNNTNSESSQNSILNTKIK